MTFIFIVIPSLTAMSGDIIRCIVDQAVLRQSNVTVSTAWGFCDTKHCEMPKGERIILPSSSPEFRKRDKLCIENKGYNVENI